VSVTRILTAADAEPLTALLRANWDFLAPWMPARADKFFTVAGQREILARELDAYAREAMIPLAIVDADGELAGRITINGISRGAFQSASIGYWVAKARNGRGLASAAVGEIAGIAFHDLGLHRLQAETLLHNTASQRVLRRNGFQPFAVAPLYLKIAGEWQDHVLFQLLNSA
jgi:[ribosomal protein S5]-alanine N-acetyltransferase